MLWLPLAYWAFDAGQRGTSQYFRGAADPIFPFFGTLIYVIVLPPEDFLDSRERERELTVLEREIREKADVCPNSRSFVEKDYLLCPECGWDLKKPCENRRRPLQVKWSTCLYDSAARE